MNGHVPTSATISTKKVNFDLASPDAEVAVLCSPLKPPNNHHKTEGKRAGLESKDRITRSESSQCQPQRSVSSPPSSTIVPRLIADVVCDKKEIVGEDNSNP